MDGDDPDRPTLKQRLLALFALGLVLLNLPLLGLWLLAGPGWGASLGVFGVWAGLIALMAALLERKRP
jgi:membrane associated rhomboid family serine protease